MTDRAALNVDGQWYFVKHFATSHALIEDMRLHIAEGTGFAYELGKQVPPGDVTASGPTHVLFDGRQGRMIPLGVITHGGGDPDPE